MATPPVRIVCYDMVPILRYFRSCAVMIATQAHTRMQWTTYRDSKVLNAIYTVMFWKEAPGIAEVTTSRGLDQEIDRLHLHYSLAWLRKLATEGPGSATRYVQEMGRLREVARQALMALYQDANAINAGVAEETRKGINTLAAIRLGAGVGVAVIGAGASIAFVSAAAAGGVGGASLTIFGMQAGTGATGFAVTGGVTSVANSLISNFDQGGTAQVAGIAWEGGKIGVAEGAGLALGGQMARGLKVQAANPNIIRSLQGEIDKHSARLVREGVTRKQAAKAAQNIVHRSALLDQRSAALNAANRTVPRLAAAAKVVPVFFAGLDVWNSVVDFNATWQPAR